MTGPTLPRIDLGSNAIGKFAIGISPIGTISPFDYWDTIISQYANSPTLAGWIGSFFSAADQTADFDAFYDLIWNVTTAEGYGLDVWGRIVGVSRIVQIGVPGDYFGMLGPVSASGNPYNVSPFFNAATFTENFSLTDAAYRTLIYAKAAANISDGSIKSINQILLALFPGRGNCYAADGGDMTMTYTFEFALTPVELTIVQQSGVLPKPVGVSTSIVVPP